MPRFLSLTTWKIDIDIPIIIMLIAVNLTESVLTNFILYRTCYQTLGYNMTICANLSGHPHIEEKVQPVSTVLIMAKTITTAVLPAVLGIFLGPWSDKHGRKPLIISPMLGYSLCFCCITALTFFPNASPWFIVASYIPVALLGGVTVILTGVFCYVSDKVIPQQRAVRLGILQGFIALGLLIGQLSSGPLFKIIGYTGVFMVGAAGYFIAMLYTIFLLEESVKLEHEPEGLRGILNIDHLTDVLTAAFKRRPNNNRYTIWIIFATLALLMFTMDGKFEVDYLYVRHRFQWGLEEFAKFNSITLIVQIVGSMIGIYFLNKVCNFSEVAITILSFSSSVVVSLVRSSAVSGWQLYSAIPLSALEGLSGPMIRTLLSKSVPENESGKVFAMAASIESLMPLIAAPTYTYLYNSTISTFAGACYVLNAGVSCVTVLLFSTLLCKRHGDMEDLVPVVDEEVEPNIDKDM